MILENFLARFPEFQNTEDKLILMAISEAESELSKESWGKLYETGIKFLAADKLAKSPMGEPVRLVGESNKTTYGLEFERLCRLVFVGARVA